MLLAEVAAENEVTWKLNRLLVEQEGLARSLPGWLCRYHNPDNYTRALGAVLA